MKLEYDLLVLARICFNTASLRRNMDLSKEEAWGPPLKLELAKP